MKTILILLAAFVAAGCATYRPYPELVEKNYAPVRGGTIQHISPKNAKEGHQYMLATRDIMKKFCNQKYKIISVNGVKETTGYSNADVQLAAGISVGQSDAIKEDKIRVKFTCDPTPLSSSKKTGAKSVKL